MAYMESMGLGPHSSDYIGQEAWRIRYPTGQDVHVGSTTIFTRLDSGCKPTWLFARRAGPGVAWTCLDVLGRLIPVLRVCHGRTPKSLQVASPTRSKALRPIM